MTGEPLPPGARERLLADARELAGEGGELLHGRYRLVRELGRGGMGVVYEAEDVALRRRVALKRLALRALAGPGLAEQVLREARAAARLDHPGIAAVYDAYDDAIVMQLVDGRPLSELGPRPPRELVAWIRDAARAVHHAHAQGVVHRDLKPHNLLVAGGRVVVTDFGLAKELGAEGSVQLHGSGSILGTPAYMPPEQASGRARDVDARSDVYALGATLYDRLAGRPPFAHRDLVALLRAVVEDEPAPLRSLAPAIPADLARVVHRCLEKEKQRRYQSAAELADDLERWLEGRPVLARSPSLRYRLAKAARRHRAALSAAALVALAGLGALAWSWSERRERASAEEALALAEEVNRLLDNARLYAEHEGRESQREELARGIARCEAFLARRPGVALVEAKLARLYSLAGRRDEALAACERALALEPGNAQARLERGVLLAEQAGERGGERAGDGARAAADLATALADESALSVLDARRGEAARALLEGRDDDAQRLYAELARQAPHLGAPPALAALALARGDPDEAFRQAMSAVDFERGFAPAYVARRSASAASVAASSAPSAEADGAETEGAEATLEAATLEIHGLAGRFCDWGARLSERGGTAAAYAHRATGEARRAARFAGEGRAADALLALERAAADLGSALAIEPGLAAAHADRGLVELARSRLLAADARGDEARAARRRARADLARALELAPDSESARENWELVLEPR